MKLAFLLAAPLFLFEEAGDNPSGGGAAAAPPADPAGDPAKAEDDPGGDPAPAATKPGFLAAAIGAAKGNGALVAENRGLRTQVGTLTSQLSALTAERDRLAARVSGLEGERSQIQTAIDQASADARSVERATTQALAAVGVPRDQLPAASATSAGGSALEQLQAALEAETDPAKRGRLSVQIWEEMKAAKK